MPQDDIDNAPIEAQPEQPAAPTAPAAPTGISREEALNLMRGMMEEVVATRASAPVAATPAPREAEPEAATDEEWQTNPRLAAAKDMRRQLFTVRQEMNEFKSFGVNKLADLTTRVATQNLPYYGEYRKEIDAKLAGLDPIYRSDPATIKLVHDTVVADHAAELIAKARTEGINAARGDAPLPHGNSRSMPREPEVDTPEALGYSPDQIDEMKRIGRGNLDEFARTVSSGRIDSWKTYVERSKKAAAAPKRSGRAVIPFARLEPKKANG